MDAIQNAIAQAQAAAGALPAQVNGMQQGGALTTAGPGVSVESLLASSMAVDHWLKVNEFGIQVGTNKALFDTLKVGLRLGEVAYCKAVKYGSAPPTYEHCFDGVTSTKGGTWAEALVRARKVDPKARDYASANIPFVALEDIVDPKKKEVIAEQGQTLGHGLSTTGWANFAKFIKALQAKGVDISNDTVVFTLGWQERNSNGNTWGVFTYDDVEVVDAFPWDV
ncbi:hypothetical protein ACUN0C_20030 [Faunimonas sp. B44]|uniref:hypothetical protein n=1 Tax=Faunimonas sp. B44 TaxID=3461493 RepID=UPI004044723B